MGTSRSENQRIVCPWAVVMAKHYTTVSDHIVNLISLVPTTLGFSPWGSPILLSCYLTFNLVFQMISNNVYNHWIDMRVSGIVQDIIPCKITAMSMQLSIFYTPLLLALVQAQTATISLGDLNQYIPAAVRTIYVSRSSLVLTVHRAQIHYPTVQQFPTRETRSKVSIYPCLPICKPISRK